MLSILLNTMVLVLKMVKEKIIIMTNMAIQDALKLPQSSVTLSDPKVTAYGVKTPTSTNNISWNVKYVCILFCLTSEKPLKVKKVKIVPCCYCASYLRKNLGGSIQPLPSPYKC